jgi:multimeric flavodoxin WrbA
LLKEEKKGGETMEKSQKKNLRMRNLKIIGIVGSPRKGNTEIMVRASLEGVKQAGAETKIILLRDLKLEMCDGCLECDKTGKCHFDDGMNEINEKLAGADGFIIGTPARWSLLSGNLKVFMDRTNPLAMPGRLKGKVAGIIAVGQSSKEEEESSISKAANSVRNYCSNAGIEVVGVVLGFEAFDKGDIRTNIETIENCKKLGRALVEHLETKHYEGGKNQSEEGKCQ